MTQTEMHLADTARTHSAVCFIRYGEAGCGEREAYGTAIQPVYPTETDRSSKHSLRSLPYTFTTL